MDIILDIIETMFLVVPLRRLEKQDPYLQLLRKKERTLRVYKITSRCNERKERGKRVKGIFPLAWKQLNEKLLAVWFSPGGNLLLGEKEKVKPAKGGSYFNLEKFFYRAANAERGCSFVSGGERGSHYEPLHLLTAPASIHRAARRGGLFSAVFTCDSVVAGACWLDQPWRQRR